MGTKPKESKIKGRINAKRQNVSNFNEKAPFRPLRTVPRTQKALFDKILEMIVADPNPQTSAASITTYLVGNKLVDLES